MLLLITVMCVIAEKKLQLNIASLRCRNFYHWWYFNWGGSGLLGPPSWLRLRPSVWWSGGEVGRWHFDSKAAWFISLLVKQPDE